MHSVSPTFSVQDKALRFIFSHASWDTMSSSIITRGFHLHLFPSIRLSITSFTTISLLSRCVQQAIAFSFLIQRLKAFFILFLGLTHIRWSFYPTSWYSPYCAMSIFQKLLVYLCHTFCDNKLDFMEFVKSNI